MNNINFINIFLLFRHYAAVRVKHFTRPTKTAAYAIAHRIKSVARNMVQFLNCALSPLCRPAFKTKEKGREGGTEEKHLHIHRLADACCAVDCLLKRHACYIRDQIKHQLGAPGFFSSTTSRACYPNF